MPGLLSQENRRALARGLLETTQAAGNSAASTVSAPVDALAWLLRKAGAPIPQAPFGGSDWMKAQGLMRDVQSPVANAVGETLGGVLPIVAAAKGPQIAAGLLKMGENAAARTPMNAATGNQAGAIVWHGSPHKFDRFDSSKIGTGEGAQAYGHGSYLAEAQEVAQGYKNRLGSNEFASIPKELSAAIPKQVGNDIARRGMVAVDDQLKLELELLPRTSDPQTLLIRTNMIDALQRLKASGDVSFEKGNLYKVDLPDDAIARMLDWDKPLSQQAPEEMKSAFNKLTQIYPDLKDQFFKAYREQHPGSHYYSLLNDYAKTGDLVKNQAFAAQAMKGAGIPGIRYLDSGSRGVGAGTSNFVVFPGNEGLLNILERNGQPLR